MKTIVVRVRDYWELIKVMDAKTFSGKDHNKKAVEYFEKKVELDKGRVKMIYHTEYEHNGQRTIGTFVPFNVTDSNA